MTPDGPAQVRDADGRVVLPSVLDAPSYLGLRPPAPAVVPSGELRSPAR